MEMEQFHSSEHSSTAIPSIVSSDAFAHSCRSNIPLGVADDISREPQDHDVELMRIGSQAE